MTDTTAAMRALIGDPRLSRYFHLDEPGRTGLQIIDSSPGLGVAGATPVGTTAVLAPAGTSPEPGRVTLQLDRATCEAGTVDVAWRLPSEGVSGAATLRETGGVWTVDDFRLVER